MSANKRNKPARRTLDCSVVGVECVSSLATRSLDAADVFAVAVVVVVVTVVTGCAASDVFFCRTLRLVTVAVSSLAILVRLLALATATVGGVALRVESPSSLLAATADSLAAARVTVLVDSTSQSAALPCVDASAVAGTMVSTFAGAPPDVASEPLLSPFAFEVDSAARADSWSFRFPDELRLRVPSVFLYVPLRLSADATLTGENADSLLCRKARSGCPDAGEFLDADLSDVDVESELSSPPEETRLISEPFFLRTLFAPLGELINKNATFAPQRGGRDARLNATSHNSFSLETISSKI
jgi:hypothetical protein